MRHGFIVFGLAASFVAAPFAHAGDAVVPDEFEQHQATGACDAYGAGFTRLPGTDTCMRTGGQVRFEKRYSNRSSSFGSRTVLEFETRSD